MEKSQSEPRCSVEEGGAAGVEARARQRRLPGALGQLGLLGHAPFDSLLPAAGGRASLPA